ncbi:MAG: hypothetical protein KA714_21210 [Limnoraphis sp. WC205]|jgi:hypothetical protein|nr:hypothetical protein [Limnoraphis sp. WC205]
MQVVEQIPEAMLLSHSILDDSNKNPASHRNRVFGETSYRRSLLLNLTVKIEL